MKAVEGFKMRSLGRERIIVPEGNKLVNFNKMISLNSTAAYLWENIQDKEFTPETLATLLAEKYEVSYEQALADSKAIAAKWIEAGIVSE